MKNDKQIYLIFQAEPQWLYLLAGWQSPGPSRFESVTFKAIESRSDGILVCDAIEGPMTVVEVQGYYDQSIYARTALEMALLQKQNPHRVICGFILFLDPTLDPKTVPWTRIIQSISLVEAIAKLQQEDPHHPMIAVFQPLLIENDENLEKEAGLCYTRIKNSMLSEPTKEVLLEVFLSWIEQRLSHKGKKEIEEMMLGQLPDLRDTQSGKDLIAIGRLEGEREGKLEGKREALLEALEIRFGGVSSELREQIMKIDSIDSIDRIYKSSLTASKLSDVFGE